MKRISLALVAAAALVGAAACGDSTGPNTGSLDLSPAYSTVTLGFENVASTFNGGMPGEPWAPEPMGGMDGMGGHHMGGPRMGGGPMDGGLMGGGLGPMFLGGFGFDFGHGRHGDDHLNTANCSFNASSGRVECAAETRNGLTIVRSAAYSDASGTPQSAFDSLTTNTINTRITVSGTVTRRDSAVSTVSNSSDRTVTGLAKGSTQRTINGTSAGRETTVGKDSLGTFTAVRTVGDTTKNVVIPAPSAGSPPPFPSSGTVIRAMQATVTWASRSQSTSRREVITYNGSATANLVITQDGVTKNCTISLPRGRPVCQ